MSMPAATTTNEGAITTRRRSQSGMQKETKPCMIVWPAMTATIELEKPEDNRASINRPAATSPRIGARVRESPEASDNSTGTGLILLDGRAEVLERLFGTFLALGYGQE